MIKAIKIFGLLLLVNFGCSQLSLSQDIQNNERNNTTDSLTSKEKTNPPIPLNIDYSPSNKRGDTRNISNDSTYSVPDSTSKRQNSTPINNRRNLKGLEDEN